MLGASLNFIASCFIQFFVFVDIDSYLDLLQDYFVKMLLLSTTTATNRRLPKLNIFERYKDGIVLTN